MGAAHEGHGLGPGRSLILVVWEQGAGFLMMLYKVRWPLLKEPVYLVFLRTYGVLETSKNSRISKILEYGIL